jgi:hypothetical protein
MYCPNCSQLVPDNTRFCSRCGLSLTDLAAWLAGHGALSLPDKRQKPPSPRRKGMRFGAKMMFWAAVALPVFMVLSIAADSPGPLFLPFLVFLAGLSILLYSRLFAEDVPVNKFQPQQPLWFAGQSNNALPPAAETGVITPSRREVRTAEVARPPSVTEHTTKLLDND